MSLFNKPVVVREEHELIPAGMHPGVLISIVDMGTHPESWEGVTSNKHKIRLTWELDSEEKMKDGRPFVIGKEYTISEGKWGAYIAKTSGLFGLLKGWMQWEEKQCKLGNLSQCIGKPALIQVTHVAGKNDPTKTFNSLANVTPLMKGMKPPKQVNPSVMFELGKSLSEPGEGFDLLPEWMQGKILACLEFNGGVPIRLTDDKKPEASNDGVPF